MKQKTLIIITLLVCLLGTSCSNTNDKKKASVATDAKVTKPAAKTQKQLSGYTQYQFDTKKKYQTIDGFGAAYTWYSDQIFFNTTEPEKLLDSLFADAKMTVLRFKNEYEYRAEDEAPNVDTMLKIYTAAKERAAKYGEDVIVLMSCWSPPAKLKKGDDITGKATLKKDKNGNYVYEDYAKWWTESVKYYESKGIKINFVSIQNEADFAAEYDGCTFDIIETKKSASYAKAYLAVYRDFQSALGKEAPAMLGPETMSCKPETLYSYMEEIMQEEPDSIYGISHHLYVGGESNDKEDSCRADSFMMNFLNYKEYFKDYKLWQTEFYVGHAIDTATVINNYMTFGNANAYLYWSGVWTSETGAPFESGELIGIEGNNGGTGWTTKADYYALRHYSEFIRPGYTRIDTKSGNPEVRTSAYINKDGSKMAIVLINRSKNKVDLQLNGVGYTINKSNIFQSVVGATCESNKDLYKNIGSLGKENSISLPGESITTIDIDGKMN